jgi:hypothetical protein
MEVVVSDSVMETDRRLEIQEFVTHETTSLDIVPFLVLKGVQITIDTEGAKTYSVTDGSSNRGQKPYAKKTDFTGFLA